MIGLVRTLERIAAALERLADIAEVAPPDEHARGSVQMAAVDDWLKAPSADDDEARLPDDAA